MKTTKISNVMQSHDGEVQFWLLWPTWFWKVTFHKIMGLVTVRAKPIGSVNTHDVDDKI